MRVLLILLLLAGAVPAQDKKEEKKRLETGGKAPPFKLKNQDDKEVELAGILGKEWIVLAFYPRAATPG